jgi:hypothetical protein
MPLEEGNPADGSTSRIDPFYVELSGTLASKEIWFEAPLQSRRRRCAQL